MPSKRRPDSPVPTYPIARQYARLRSNLFLKADKWIGLWPTVGATLVVLKQLWRMIKIDRAGEQSQLLDLCMETSRCLHTKKVDQLCHSSCRDF